MCNSRRGGFTLVELLVVVVIIGVLVGLLMPAIQAAREAARQTKCLNHQKEIGEAIIHYTVAKDRYPGHTNPSLGANSNSWFTSILDHLDRKNIWEQWRDDGAGPTVQIGVAVCPNDPEGPNDRLSYVANGPGPNGAADATIGIFRDRTQVFDVSPSAVTSSPTTPLVAEKVAISGTSRLWHVPGVASTFLWPTPQPGFLAIRDLTLPANDPQLASNHPGIVIVTFCDGHSEKLRLDKDNCYDYDPGPQ